MATYAQRMSANPTRTGAHRGTDGIRWLVIHTSEGGEGLTSAENLAAFIQTPRTSTNLASYHYIFDTDRIIPIVPDAWIAYAAGGGNAQGLHACYPGKAGQTPEQWADNVSSAQHEQAAQWLVDKGREYDIPLVKLGADDLRAGKRGVCGHHDVSLAFKKSDHTDPGKAYPWTTVLGRAQQLAAPPVPFTPIIGDDVTVCVNLNGGYWLTNWVQRTPLVYPGNDLALIAAMWELEDMGVRFSTKAGTPGQQGRTVPVPFPVMGATQKTFDALPTS